MTKENILSIRRAALGRPNSKIEEFNIITNMECNGVVETEILWNKHLIRLQKKNLKGCLTEFYKIQRDIFLIKSIAV